MDGSRSRRAGQFAVRETTPNPGTAVLRVFSAHMYCTRAQATIIDGWTWGVPAAAVWASIGSAFISSPLVVPLDTSIVPERRDQRVEHAPRCATAHEPPVDLVGAGKA